MSVDCARGMVVVPDVQCAEVVRVLNDEVGHWLDIVVKNSTTEDKWVWRCG